MLVCSQTRGKKSRIGSMSSSNINAVVVVALFVNCRYEEEEEVEGTRFDLLLPLLSYYIAWASPPAQPTTRNELASAKLANEPPAQSN